MKPNQHNNERLAAGGVLLATLLTYASTFTFGWVYDDPPQIPQNQDLQWSRLGYLFTHHLWASAGPGARFYRPLLTVWFLIIKTVFGLNPHWFHVTTVLAHVAATGLAYAVARRLLKDPGAALACAAIFGLHPLQAETASWISSVNDSLAAALCFASFLSYKRAASENELAGNANGADSALAEDSAKGVTDGLRPRIWWALSGSFFVLALLTKEVSIVLPAFIVIDLLATPCGAQSATSKRGAMASIAALYGLIAIAWLGFRAWILGQPAASSSFVSWRTILLSAPKIILFDFSRILFPRGLSPQYDLRLVESMDAQFAASLAILLLIVFIAVAGARRRPQLWTPFAWLAFPILPTLNLHWLNQHDFVHDRYTYISLFGVALLAGHGYSALKERWPRSKLIGSATALVLAMLAFASAVQSQYWANDVVLFARAVQIAPGNEWAHLNYGAALSSRGKDAEAAPHFVRSYELSPGWRAADFAGYAFQHSGNLFDAERWYQTAIEANPTLATAWFGLGQVRLEQHRLDEATTALKKAIELQPASDGYHYELGSALEQAGHGEEALKEYRMELQLHPYQVGARKAIERLGEN